MDPFKKQKLFTGHDGAIYALSEGASPNRFYAGGADTLVTEWDLNDVVEPRVIAKATAIVYALNYVRDQNLLLIGESKGGIHAIDLDASKEIKFLVRDIAPIFDIKYSAKHNRFYSVSGDGHFSTWSLENLALVETVKLCDKKVRALDINPSGDQIAIACGDASIRIFNLESGKEIRRIPGHEGSVYSVKFSPDGKYLLSGAHDAHLNVWEIESDYKLIHSVPGHNYSIYSIVFSPDTKHFATGSRDKTLKIWDANTFEVIQRLDKEKSDGHKNSVNKLLLMEYQDLLISCGDYRSIIVWKALTLDPSPTLPALRFGRLEGEGN